MVLNVDTTWFQMWTLCGFQVDTSWFPQDTTWFSYGFHMDTMWFPGNHIETSTKRLLCMKPTGFLVYYIVVFVIICWI